MTISSFEYDDFSFLIDECSILLSYLFEKYPGVCFTDEFLDWCCNVERICVILRNLVLLRENAEVISIDD